MEATHPLVKIGPKTIKDEFDLKPEEILCSLCEMQVLIPEGKYFIRRHSHAFKPSFIFNEKTSELKYHNTEISQRKMYTDLWGEWRCVKSK